MTSKQFFLFQFILMMSFGLLAQEPMKIKPSIVSKVTSMQHVLPIAQQNNLEPSYTKDVEAQDGKASKFIVVPNKDTQKKDDYFTRQKLPLNQKVTTQGIKNVFNAFTSSTQPTDPTLAVGRNHVFVTFNLGFIIYDKEGNALTGQVAPNPTIFPDGGCCDMTVSYDSEADRWVLTFLNTTSGAQIAVSDGPDPVNDGWYVYTISAIQDYQKLSVWSDGYYMTENSSTSNKVWALERDQMLQGNPDAQILGFDLPGIVTYAGFYSPQVLNVTNDNMPAPGNVPIVFMQDDAWPGVNNDHLKLWLLNVDWAIPANSNISSAQEFDLTPFISVFDEGDISNLTQPNNGTAIDALQSTIMNQAQFRKFGDHNSAVFNFVVDIKADATEQAGVRWIELRQPGDGQPWSLYQEGTYTAQDNRHAWNASIMMDSFGNMGMGYTSMSSSESTNTTFVSSYYTGRFAADPHSTMSVSEELIANGNGNIPGGRYGDYSKIDIDPVDDLTFWYITEYMYNNQRKGVIGVFKIAPDDNNDVGAIAVKNPIDGALTDQEEITVTLFNFGLNAQSNFEVYYQIDDGSVVTETFTGTLNSSEYVDYTFSTLADLSNEGQVYQISVSTSLTGDENTDNDSYSTSVMHLFKNDIGVTNIIAPLSSSDLTSAEDITVELTNFGGIDQTNFDVTYMINNKSITETFTDVLPANSRVDFTFSQTADFYLIGSYDITSYTTLTDDVDATNDSYSKTILKFTCQPIADCSYGDGILEFQLGSINNNSGCSNDGYADYTDQSTDLIIGSNYELTLTTGYGDQYVTIWIDFNDDFVFSIDEKVIDNFLIAEDEKEGTFTAQIPFKLPSNIALGEHLLRAKTSNVDLVPDDACASVEYGETEDYKVNIIQSDTEYDDAILIVKDLGDKQFELALTNLQYDGLITLTVHNILGQRIVYSKLNKDVNHYFYPLDMSYMATGVYLVRMGTNNFGKVQKIIVK